MIFVLWSKPPAEPTDWIGNRERGTVVSSDRWWDARTLYTHLWGDLPGYWESFDDDMIGPDYETRWIGSAAQSSANLQMQFRKSGARKWITL